MINAFGDKCASHDKNLSFISLSREVRSAFIILSQKYLQDSIKGTIFAE